MQCPWRNTGTALFGRNHTGRFGCRGCRLHLVLCNLCQFGWENARVVDLGNLHWLEMNWSVIPWVTHTVRQRAFQEHRVDLRHFGYLQWIGNVWLFISANCTMMPLWCLFSVEGQAQRRDHHFGRQGKKLFEVGAFGRCTWTDHWCIGTGAGGAWTVRGHAVHGAFGWRTACSDDELGSRNGAMAMAMASMASMVSMRPMVITSSLGFQLLLSTFGDKELLDALLAFRQLLLNITQLLALLNQPGWCFELKNIEIGQYRLSSQCLQAGKEENVQNHPSSWKLKKRLKNHLILSGWSETLFSFFKPKPNKNH